MFPVPGILPRARNWVGRRRWTLFLSTCAADRPSKRFYGTLTAKVDCKMLHSFIGIGGYYGLCRQMPYAPPGGDEIGESLPAMHTAPVSPRQPCCKCRRRGQPAAIPAEVVELKNAYALPLINSLAIKKLTFQSAHASGFRTASVCAHFWRIIDHQQVTPRQRTRIFNVTGLTPDRQGNSPLGCRPHSWQFPN